MLRELREDSRIDRMLEGGKDVLNIIRDRERRERRMRGELRSYTGEEDEPTQNNVHVHVHPQQPSKPDSEAPQLELDSVKVRGLPKWATGATVVAGLVLAAITAAASKLLAK